MRYIFLLAVLFAAFSFSATAQKVKYKDLYVLLRAENYNDADTYLRMYLVQEPEDPHANYSMGKMLQSYVEDGDLLSSDNRLVELADSSKYYFERALNLTTEKFVRKNDDEYYLDFRRRDMRSGKFEVKFSDVQFEMEQRIAALDKFNSDMNSLKFHRQTAKNFYKQSQDQYNQIVEKAETINLLYFTSTPDDIELLRNIAHTYDSSLYHLNTYRSIMSTMGANAVEQEVVQSVLDAYPVDGVGETDFLAKSIELINYKEWSDRETDFILKKIYPLKKRLISFDKRVQELHDQVVEDSLDKRDEVFQLATQNVGRDLRDYDPQSLPAALYNYRIAEINYHSAVNYYQNEIADTLAIGNKIDVLNDFSKQIIGVGRLINKLAETNTAPQQKLYSEYIAARYENAEGLTNFIEEHRIEVSEDSTLLQTWRRKLLALDKIAIWHTDSIPLTVGAVIENPESLTYTTVAIDSLEERAISFYSWARNDDQMQLAFGVSTSNRTIDTLFSVPINQALFNASLPIPEYRMDTIGLGQRVWLMTADELSEDSTYLSQIFVTDITLGPAWVNEYSTSGYPAIIQKDPETGNLILKDETDEAVLILDIYGEEVVVEEVPELPEEVKQEEPIDDGGG